MVFKIAYPDYILNDTLMNDVYAKVSPHKILITINY